MRDGRENRRAAHLSDRFVGKSDSRLESVYSEAEKWDRYALVAGCAH